MSLGAQGGDRWPVTIGRKWCLKATGQATGTTFGPTGLMVSPWIISGPYRMPAFYHRTAAVSEGPTGAPA